MTRVRFGDVVNDIKVNVDRQNNPYDIYVAGDHMDSEDLTLHRWGSFATDDVGPAFIRIFKPGQVLYGSRRTYLKKIVVAPFEGITANTTFVLETKNEDEFSQRLLPFIMLSDDFTEWSIRKSKGSTNPYVLFSDLADYEFDLPSPEEQRRLADKLWAAYELKEAYKKMIAATDEMVKAQFIEMFDCSLTIKISDITQTCSGGTPNTKKEEYYKHGTIPWLTSGEVNNGIITATKSYITESGLTNSSAKWIPANSVLIAMYGATAGKSAITKIPITTNQAICALLPSDKVNSVYLYHAIKNKEEWMINQCAGAAQPNISQKIIRDMEIPLPNINKQLEFVSIVEQAEKSKSELRQAIEKIDRVMKSLMQ